CVRCRADLFEGDSMTHLEQASINAISTLTPPRSIVSRDETGEAASRVGRTQLLRLGAPTGDQKGLKTSCRSAVRSQTSLLAPVERVCLTWLAQRMPAWVMPDHLTLLG